MPVAAHGLETRPLYEGGIGLEVTYETGEPLADAAVTVYSPDDPGTPFLELRADRHGRFMFLPDRPGTWAAVVRDGSGHGVRYDFEVNEALRAAATDPEGSLSTTAKLVAAACVVWGLIGTALYFRRKAA